MVIFLTLTSLSRKCIIVVQTVMKAKYTYMSRGEANCSGSVGGKTKLEVHGSLRARLKVKNSYKIRRKVHSSATAGAR